MYHDLPDAMIFRIGYGKANAKIAEMKHFSPKVEEKQVNLKMLLHGPTNNRKQHMVIKRVIFKKMHKILRIMYYELCIHNPERSTLRTF